jgi:NitT/TauT family transport system substrate-binding protein
MAPGILLPAMVKEPSLDLVAVYEWLPRNANVIVVKPGSPIKSAADLAGKKIGVRNQGDPGIVVTKTMLVELGLKDDRNEYIAIGDGATAAAAIDNDRVDAMVTFDTAAARVELVGTKLRYVPLTPKFNKVGSSWICVPRKALKDDRKAYVSLFRAIAKSTLFAYSNLDAAIDAHWGVYPESKPKGKTEDEARNEMKFILKDRKENWMRRPEDSDQRFGASSLAEWKAHIEVASETAKMPDLAKQVDANKVFSNELQGVGAAPPARCHGSRPIRTCRRLMRPGLRPPALPLRARRSHERRPQDSAKWQPFATRLVPLPVRHRMQSPQSQSPQSSVQMNRKAPGR